MIDLLQQMLINAMKALMLRDIDEYIVCIGPKEFHFAQPNEIEFKCLSGKEKVTRTKLPEDYANGRWMIFPVESLDQVLDLYNSVVVNEEETLQNEKS